MGSNQTESGGARGPDGRFAKGATVSPDTQFQPGQSGNPDGRPKSLQRVVRERVGEDGQRIVDELMAILTGRKRSARDKLQAAGILLDRGFGRAVQSVELSGPGGKPIAVVDEERARSRDVLKFATDDELAELDAIWERIEQRAYAAGVSRPSGPAQAILTTAIEGAAGTHG